MGKNGKQKGSVNGMLNNEGNTVTGKDEIETVFKDFYTELFKINDGNKATRELDEIIFNTIQMIAEDKNDKNNKNSSRNIENTNNNNTKDRINKKEIENNVNRLKSKMTTDVQEWSNSILKHSGSDIINSLKIILNEIEQQHVIPREWQELIVKSIYKNKGKRNDMENRRGLFISSIISKLYEKIKLMLECVLLDLRHESGI